MTVGATRVAIVSTGIVTTAGRGADRTFAALRTGGDAPRAPRSIQSELGGLYPVFEVPDAAFGAPPVRLPGGRGRRGTRLALIAGLDAFLASGVRFASERIGVVTGATVGGMMHTEDWVEERVRGDAARVAARPAIRHLPLWDAPRELARRIGATGPVTAVTTACTSGTHAIAVAADLIVTGAADVVVAGGVDALARVTYHGFASLGLLERVRCRPFDTGRAGLNLGEGAAFVVLASERAFPCDAGPPVAWLDGWASTSDAHHATAPRPDGSGLADAMREAIRRASALPASVDWVHAHGTATQNNDDVEAEAIAAVFGDLRPAVSSTKHVFGHTLGAAGAVSAVVAVEAMRRGFVPGNGPVVRAAGARDLAIVPPGGLERTVRRVVVNSMGFGGTNCALVLSGGAP